VDRAEPLERLDFDDQPIVNKQVYPEGRFKQRVFKNDVDRLLPVDLVAHLRELSRQDRLVNRFQQSRSELSMDSQCDVHDIARNAIYVRHTEPLCASAPLREP
jgi:hypothetical protein